MIDEESIDNGNEPKDFYEADVNDNISEVGQRQFSRNLMVIIGEEITLYTGQTCHQAWFLLKEISGSWDDAGPTQSGARNFLEAGPELGQDESEDVLDEMPEATALRARVLTMLTGQIIIAVVFDSDISINYDPLQGKNLGVVAFEVLEVL